MVGCRQQQEGLAGVRKGAEEDPEPALRQSTASAGFPADGQRSGVHGYFGYAGFGEP